MCEHTYEIIRADDYEEVAEFLLANFFPEVPIGKIVNMDVDMEVRPWLFEFMKKILSFQVSICIRDPANRLIAVGINSIEYGDPARDVSISDYVDPYRHPKMWMNLNFLQDLGKGVDLFGDNCVAGLVFNMFMICVDGTISKRGLATKIVDYSIQVAKQKGITVMVTEAVSEYAGRIFSKFGFTVAKQIDYNDYVYHSSRPLANNGVHKAGRLFVYHLSRSGQQQGLCA